MEVARCETAALVEVASSLQRANLCNKYCQWEDSSQVAAQQEEWAPVDSVLRRSSTWEEEPSVVLVAVAP